MSVNIDWSEDHEDFQKLQAIVDSYAQGLDAVDVDIEYHGDVFVVFVNDLCIGGVADIDDIIWAIEDHLEYEYQTEYAAEES